MEEGQNIKTLLARMKETLLRPKGAPELSAASREFATSFIKQLYIVTTRSLAHDWWTPVYLYSMVLLILGMVRNDAAHDCPDAD